MSMPGLRQEHGEGKAMTLWERILQGVTAFSLETIIGTVAAVLGARLVFQYLPVADYGQLALFLSFYATGRVFLSFDLGRILIAEIARARGTGELGWARFLISRFSMFSLTMGTLLLFLFVGIGVRQGEMLLWSAMGVYLWLTALNTSARALLHGTTRYRRLAAQSITASLGLLTVRATLPWWWSGERLSGVALTYPLMELATALASVYLARAAWLELKESSTTAYNYRNLLSLFAQKGVYATLSIPVQKLASQLPIWFLNAMVGDVGVGAFAAADRAYHLIFTFFASTETTLFPLVSELAHIDTERLRVALRQAQKYTFWLGLIVAVVGNATASWVMLLIAGEQYARAIPLLRLLLWGLLLHAFSQSQRPIFYAIGKQKWLFVTSLLSTAIECALLFIGIGLVGTIGAAWGVLLRSCAFVTIGYILIRRLAPGLWIDPRGILKVEEFDLRLWRGLWGRR